MKRNRRKASILFCVALIACSFQFLAIFAECRKTVSANASLRLLNVSINQNLAYYLPLDQGRRPTYTAEMALALIVGGDDGGSVGTAELFNPVLGGFTLAGNMVALRFKHTATALGPRGLVLIIGGEDGNGQPLASAELYDPGSHTFVLTNGGMSTARFNHTATSLSDGTVLITGGMSTQQLASASAELYNPATRTFRSVGDMNTTRWGHRAALLGDGRVLVTGGEQQLGGPILSSAELYDPAQGTFSPAGDMIDSRWNHSATLLHDGRVLVVGGFDGDLVTVFTAEIYDPLTGQFTPTASMMNPRSKHSATLLPDGRVLVASGDAGSPLVPAEVYDPTSEKFQAVTGSPSVPSQAALLSTGQVLFAGGNNGPTEPNAWLYSLATNSVASLAAQTKNPRLDHTLTALDWDAPGPTHLGKVLELVATLFGGIAVDGSGIAFVGGAPIPVGPWGELSPGMLARRDILIGLAIEQLASNVGDRPGQSKIRVEALELVRTKVNELLASLR